MTIFNNNINNTSLVNSSQIGTTYVTSGGHTASAVVQSGQIWLYRPFISKRSALQRAQTVVHEHVHLANPILFNDLFLARAVGYSGNDEDEASLYWGAELAKHCRVEKK